MKKNILIIMLCLSLILITNGCNNKPNNFKDTINAVSRYFGNSKVDRSNLGAFYVDEENNIIVVKLVENTSEKQEEFLNATNIDRKYIKFEHGGPYLTFDTEIFTLDNAKDENTSFNKYLTKEDRNIYLEKNIAELYIFDHQDQFTLKDYVINTNQSLENIIKSITDLLDKQTILKDGGTTIYKKDNKNMTVITCNTVSGNNDIYIGDYHLKYNDMMCK